MPKKKPPPPTAEFISLADAGLIIGVCRATIRRYVAQGKLRGYSNGGQVVRVRAEEVRELLRPIPAGGSDA